MHRNIFVILLFICLLGSAAAQSPKDRWVDSVFKTMTEEAKIGQLFLIPVSSSSDESELNDIERYVKSHKIGGLFFTSGHPRRQVALTNKFQSFADVPLFIGFDASGGLGNLLDSTIRFPNSLALSAISSDSLFLETSREIGRQMAALGINLSLGLTANLFEHTEGKYNFDLFGDNKYLATHKLSLYMEGLKSARLLTCAKHFPIQGITITNISKGVPVVRPFIDSVQAFPFQQLFKKDLDMVMPGASQLPIFYEAKKAARKNKFSSAVLSSFFAGDWIKKQMGYNGLVVVDIRALEKAPVKLKGSDAEVFAFQAGNDVLLTNSNPGAAIRKIKKLIKKEKQYAIQLDNSVKKILEAKYDADLHKRRAISETNLLLTLNASQSKIASEHAYKSAMAVVRNAANVLPITSLENRKFTTVALGDTVGSSAFHRAVLKYVPAEFISITDTSQLNLLQTGDEGSTLLILLKPETPSALIERMQVAIEKSPEPLEVIIADFGCYPFIKHVDDYKTVISTFGTDQKMFSTVPQAIFGAFPVSGQLPLKMGSQMAGARKVTRSLRRFEYSFPEDAGISSATLKQIDLIAKEAIDIGGTPGCHVLVAKEGKVVYEKSFGHLTYEKQIPVTDSTLYDLASITKVAATLQAVMFLYDRGMIDIHKKASFYLPELKASNKKDATLKEVLTHQAGLWPFLPFWAQTMKDSRHLPEYYASKPTMQYPYLVAQNLFANVGMRDSLWNWIIRAKVREKPARTPYDYKYSDMGFYVLQHLSEKILNQPMEDFLAQNLYEPLGAHTTGYLPLLKFGTHRIAPTENDQLFRKSLLIGTVHDQGAAMHGGVAGHAGLFSTANDLAKLGQMLLQEGYYGGYQYYRPETVRTFTNKQFATSRRGLGWDKPIQSDHTSPTSLSASPRTFGHTGFTGTCLWVDPEFNLVYIFLSNRVHPDMTNTKLLNANIRSRIQDVIYQGIFDHCKLKTEELIPATTATSAAR